MKPLFVRLRRLLFRRAYIPAAIALAVVTLCAMFADYQNAASFGEQQRAAVADRINLIRARIEGDIGGDIQLVRGLVGVVSTEPDMNEERFAELAGPLFTYSSQLRDVVAAPDLVVRMVFPRAGNDGVLGLDYRLNPRQQAAALRARDTGRLVLAGPVELVQGGTGLVARFPVFTPAPWGRHFWGIISAVIDVEQVYADSGLLDASSGLDVALTGKDGLGIEGVRFFGDERVLDANPVLADINLPGGIWQVAATPRGGWSDVPPNAGIFRLLISLAGALIVVPVLFTGRLIEERQRNIAALRSRETELKTLSRRLGLALETSRVGVWEYDMLTGALLWDDRMNEIHGLPADGGVRSIEDWRRAIHPEDLRRAEEELRSAMEAAGTYHSEYRVVTPEGEVRNVRAMGTLFNDPETTPKVVGVNWDVSSDVALNADLRRAHLMTQARAAELEAAKTRIEHNALHDPLTGLPNRRYLDEMLKRLREEHDNLVLLHMDLDRFKQINDTLGHAAGDAILLHASKVLKSNVRHGEFVARTGGDEFIIACTSDGGAVDAAALASRIITEMRRPMIYDGHECRLGVSVGIAAMNGEQVGTDQLLINADIALYRAKNRGRNRFEFFTEALQAEVINAKRTADELLAGIERNEFVAYYQPQFDARTCNLVGVEALVRWHHPSRGVLGPDAFLGIAEEISILAAIDRLVLDQALDNQARWNAQGLNVPRVSVNVSARRLHDENLIKGLKQQAIRPGTVAFELVESIYLDESDELMAWNIDQLGELGIDIEIDDFGTGYASILSLLKLKPRRLKIDRQLVMPITSSLSQRHLVKSIIEIGKSAGVEVVAEGVETMEHAGILRDLGCDYLQGYAFAPALSAEALDMFLRDEAWRQAS